MSPKVTTEDPTTPKSRGRFTRSQAVVRTKAASLVRIVFGVLATILALGAVLVVLRDNVNEQNSIVELVTSTAETIAGPLSRDDGVFAFSGANAESKNALLNWGIAALAYLVVGRLLAAAIAPRRSC